MEGCIETTTVDGNETTTVFTKDGVLMDKRVVSVSGSLKIERWYDAIDSRHRDNDLPAIIYYYDDKILIQCWYKDGKYHREGDQPAKIHYEYDKITSQYWYKDGKLHREGQPAEIHYKDDKITSQYWFKDGELHHEGQPAAICYKDGEIISQYWYKDGKRHRDNDLPTIIHYRDGKIANQCWPKDGKYYRKIGPNFIELKDGIISNSWFDTNGSEINYLDVPEERRLSHEFRQAIRQLPLPIGDAITWHFVEIWQFVESD